MQITRACLAVCDLQGHCEYFVELVHLKRSHVGAHLLSKQLSVVPTMLRIQPTAPGFNVTSMHNYAVKHTHLFDCTDLLGGRSWGALSAII